ncbi:carboxymuconolactone decarboxylase family protein [Cohnella faecalis]|uniref:carboxymuconolactone decarboxylase family protein n=1 Tax=Cohnella faecalis TaxID=2315694 RepID=UPI00361F20A0
MSLRFNYRAANEPAYQAMRAMEAHISQSGVDKVLYELIKIRVSQINGCSFCLDMHAKDLMKLGDHADRILLIGLWREVPIFTDKEKAVLELAEHVTNISQVGVPQPVYENVRAYFDEKEYIDLIVSINTINSWNRIAIATGMFPGCFS